MSSVPYLPNKIKPKHDQKPSVMLYTDGACTGNPGPGGWAAILVWGEHQKSLSGFDPQTTNNRMELMAPIEGLKALKQPCSVIVVSDSQYVVHAFTKGWVESWQRRNWQTADKKPVKNKDLWLELLKQVEIHRVMWEWVRGHNGHIYNELCDEIARKEIEKHHI